MEPDPERGDWIRFLHFLVDEKEFSATMIIHVVERDGADYEDEYHEFRNYIAEGDDE